MSLKNRITFSMLSVVAVSVGVSAAIGGYLLRSRLRQEAESRMQENLNAAREFYGQRLQAMVAALHYTALGERFCQAVTAKDLSYLRPRLAAVRRSARLDVLYVTDAAGGVALGAHCTKPVQLSLVDDPLVAAILDGKKTASGAVLVPIETLRREDPSLAGRARVRILPTPKASPESAVELREALMLCAAAAVHAPDGRLAGVLRAGVLLSHDHDLVDQVENTVFRDERYRGKLLGCATVFQEDVRISTNILAADGSRMVGTRVSAEVKEAVLGQRKTWIGRAWVVDEWYVAAYAPLHDVSGRAVGMLSVGVRQCKFRDAARRTYIAFALVVSAGLSAAAAVAWGLARSISRPIGGLAQASAAIAQGDFSQTLTTGSADEIGALAQSFNTMARSLRERDEHLRDETRQHLTRSERLASIGRLAAGVAHEINNPLTGVVTFAHMLLRDAPAGSQQKDDIETIINAAMRCRDVVRGLLDFSRQTVPNKSLSDLNAVLSDALNLTQNQANLHGVRVAEELAADLPRLVLDPGQIQEVAVNLVVNAVDAMPDGGDLCVRTRVVDEGGNRWVEFGVSDTGCGIPRENLKRVFDPFFTSKEVGKGTGLGLAISYGIVSEHGGQIDVSSEPGQGTTVTVRLPLISQETHNDESDTTIARSG